MTHSYKILLIVALSVAAGLAASQRLRADITESLYAKLDLFGDAVAIIQNHYVKEVSVEDLIYGAIEGMVSKLDAHSSFLPPRAFDEMQVETKGEFGGIGIEITTRDGWLTVVSPIEDTPASRAGLEAADRIIAIEGKSTRDMSLQDAVEKLRGKIGTEVEITIIRPKNDGFDDDIDSKDIDWGEPFDVLLVRDKIRVKSVRHELLEDDSILYIRLLQFQQRTGDDLKAILREGNINQRSGLILDLRNNPGGLLDQSIEVADALLTEGKIVYTDGREPAMHKEWFAKARGSEPTVPIAVLINGGTASASEIVAGALQDHKRATLFGSRTFGKGSVQTILRLRDGSGIRVTTALYYTPNGRSIQAEGIRPDIRVIPRPEMEQLITREEDLDRHFEFGQDGNADIRYEAETTESVSERFRKRQQLLSTAKSQSDDLVLDHAVDFLLKRNSYAPGVTVAEHAVTEPTP